MWGHIPKIAPNWKNVYIDRRKADSTAEILLYG